MTPSGAVIDWLLEEDDPSVRLRTLTHLLDVPSDDPSARAAREAVPDSRPVQTLLGKMTPHGTWLVKSGKWLDKLADTRDDVSEGVRKGYAGDGVEYEAYATTHYVLAYLAELGLDRSHPAITLAAERYLSLQAPDGDWWMHMSCLIGYNLHTFALLGYRDDARVLRALDYLLNIQRQDGGYLCDIHEGKYKKKEVKSCYRGALKALLAFSEFPQVWEHPRCCALADYFLERQVLYRHNKPDTYVTHELTINSFPITWGANLYEALLALSRLGFAGDPRLERAWGELLCRADSQGFYALNRTPATCPWKVGKHGERNKWVTFYAWLALKECPANLS